MVNNYISENNILLKTPLTGLSLLELSILEKRVMESNKVLLAENNSLNSILINKNFLFLKAIRLKYLSLLEKLYSVKINKELYLNKHKSKIKKRGINHAATNKYFEKIAISDYIDKNISEHVEEEYEEARQIKRHFYIHHGDTNTGKTYNSIEKLKKSKSGIYLAPLRLLALEIFQKLNFDGIPCILSTGEEEIQIPFANHISSTIEKLDITQEYDLAVIDEAQLIGDAERGKAWTKAILALKAKEIHICCSPNVVKLLQEIIISCKDTYEEEVCVRKTNLFFEDKLFKFPEDIQEGDALICFSRKKVLMYSSVLKEYGISSSVLYGRLPPDVRRQQVDLFEKGINKVVISTDAIGMGVNLSIKRVVFLETNKYNGKTSVPLNISEIRQIAGRAGRYQKYDVGYYITAENQELIESAYKTNLPEIKFAYVLPSDKIIEEFPAGTLAERLIAWKNTPSQSFYKKSDISEPLFLLDALYSNPNNKKLTINEQLKFIFVPFDIKDIDLLDYWEKAINYYIEKLPVPSPYEDIKKLRDLKEAETYYRKLDMYYAISKILNKKIDADVVLTEKANVSIVIMNYLKENKKDLYKRCNSCGSNIPIDFNFNICNKCYSKRRDSYF